MKFICAVNRKTRTYHDVKQLWLATSREGRNIEIADLKNVEFFKKNDHVPENACYVSMVAVFGEKSLRFRKYPATCERALKWVFDRVSRLIHLTTSGSLIGLK